MRGSAPMWVALRRAWPGRGSSASRSTAGADAMELAAALRRPQGPDHEGGAAHGHQSRTRCRRNMPPNSRKLQSEAPPMGWAFVKRRMTAELGPDWQRSSPSFEHHPAAAASLGQVHRARAHDGVGAGLQAAISRHAVGGRSRPQAAQPVCSRSTAGWIRRSTPPRSPRRSARGCARSSITSARPSTSRSTGRCWPAPT